jgi:GrpB-like predicted nucleotidyltransferase (UPF0157 family)
MTFHVAPYSAEWPHQFSIVAQQLHAVFAGRVVQIEHIGSTAVPGLCAKPVIDVLLGAPSLNDIEAVIPQLAAEGYAYVNKYETELPMRRYFVKPQVQMLRVHLHAVCAGSVFWNEQLAFRDALRASTQLRDAYGDLKRRLARTHEQDKAAYTAAKAPFIVQVLNVLSICVVGEVDQSAPFTR